MDYIDNLTLTILLHLLRTRELRLHANDYDTLEQLQVYISWIEALFKNKPANLSIEDDELFEESYKPCITYKTFLTDIVICCEDLGRLETYLMEYIRAYKDEDLKEYGNKNEYDSITSLSEEIKALAKYSNKSKRRHIVTGVKYTPVVADKYLQHSDFIRDMSIELVSHELIEYPIKMYRYTDSGDIEGMYQDWQEYFECRFELDIDWYMKNISTNEDISEPAAKGDKYPKQQQNMLNVLEHWVRIENKNEIPADILISRTKIKCLNIDSAVSRLNKHYMQIKETDEKLLVKHKGTGFYEISPAYIESIQTNG